jgi:hypothetical protein
MLLNEREKLLCGGCLLSLVIIIMTDGCAARDFSYGRTNAFDTNRFHHEWAMSLRILVYGGLSCLMLSLLFVIAAVSHGTFLD